MDGLIWVTIVTGTMVILEMAINRSKRRRRKMGRCKRLFEYTVWYIDDIILLFMQ